LAVRSAFEKASPGAADCFDPAHVEKASLGMASISLQDAELIISAAMEFARSNDLEPLGIAVLDDGGHVVAFEREDGSPNKRFEIAAGKARGALSFGVDSRGLVATATAQPGLIAALSDVCGPFVPAPGGVLIRDNVGECVGAVGVSGDTADNDERAAMSGIAAVGLTSKGT
jgi:uncharacterized protein GlcG (DUF336 family)